MRVLIGIFKEEFVEFCNEMRPASQNIRSVLSHEARVFLFLYRYVQDCSTYVLGALFRISKQTAMKVYDDMMMFCLYHDPYLPRVWNDATASEADIEALLTRIQQTQSPGVR